MMLSLVLKAVTHGCSDRIYTLTRRVMAVVAHKNVFSPMTIEALGRFSLSGGLR
jgi:hypothetical protein